MELVKLIKQASMEAQEQAKPTSVMLGTVISIEPLKIQISQKLILGGEQLVLSRSVTDFEIEMTVEHETQEYKKIIDTTHNHGVAKFDEQTSHKHIDGAMLETDSVTVNTSHSHNDSGEIFDITHSHNYTGRKVFKVHNALKNGEKVILVRENGGQRFYVIDRIGD